MNAANAISRILLPWLPPSILDTMRYSAGDGFFMKRVLLEGRDVERKLFGFFLNMAAARGAVGASLAALGT